MELVEEELTGIAARIVQHEYDHLDGIMIRHITSIKRRLPRKVERYRAR